MPSFIIFIAGVWWFAPAQPVEYGYCMSGKCKHINLVAAILPPASVPATINKAVSNHVAAEETLRSQGMNIKIARQKYFVLKKIFVHLSAVVDAVRGGRVWGAQVHHHVPLGPVIGGVSPEVSPLPHMLTSLQHPASLTSTDHCNSNSLRTRGGFFYHFTVSIHCIVWRKEGGDRICVECRYI